MNQQKRTLEQMALERKIRIYEPFAEFLKAEPTLHTFEISLLDCYRAAGHACHSITGAFLGTEEAVKVLFPESITCVRGDISIEFGSEIDEKASGPRSNVMSYITGAWGAKGFSGMKGKFVRKNLITYGVSDLAKNAVRFVRLSLGKSVVVEYNPNDVIIELNRHLEFPESWRVEIAAILETPSRTLKVHKEK